MRKTKILISILILCNTAISQSLYESIEFKNAFEMGTRKRDGSVSEAYWQNHASYDIKAKIDPENRKVNGAATIWYYNESPDTLDGLIFHSYKDLYKRGSVNTHNSNDDYVEGEIYNDGMIISRLTLNGKNVDLKDRRQAYHKETHYGLRLFTPLKSGDSVKLEIGWTIDIPARVNRDGAFDPTTMFVAYWYPEIAVYDDIFGWDNIVFDGSAEFYHDLSDFRVELEIPNTFLIWATSEPTNMNEILPEAVYKRWMKAKSSPEKITVISAKDHKGFATKSTTWKYEITNERDFTFAFSDHFIWEACTYSDSQGSFFLNSAYHPENPSFSHVLNIEKEAIRSFHTDFPVYPFPFKHFTAFNGEVGGGMEFPGIINDEDRTPYKAEGVPYSDYESHKLLTFHEMMHMYFPFLMGINEKRYAWMEEGMAEFSEDFFTGVNLESQRSRVRFAKSTVAPTMVPTYQDINSGTNSYDIASQSYYALLHLLGRAKFIECLNGYMDRWKNKHPSPYDFFYSFNDLSGQDLNWFWKAWYFDWGYPDLSIAGIENGKLKIENEGGRPLAFSINLTLADGTISSEMISPIVWKTSSTYEHTLLKTNQIKKVELKTLNGADAVSKNSILEL